MKNGSSYSGSFLKGEKNGFGVLIYSNKDVYSG